jgi:hypothetical protein
LRRRFKSSSPQFTDEPDDWTHHSKADSNARGEWSIDSIDTHGADQFAGIRQPQCAMGTVANPD